MRRACARPGAPRSDSRSRTSTARSSRRWRAASGSRRSGRACAGARRPAAAACPCGLGSTAAPAFLILVGARIALSGPGFDVVEPHVLGTGPVRPRLLAGDRTGVAADALVEVHHHRHLCHDLHEFLASQVRFAPQAPPASISVGHLLRPATYHGHFVALIAGGSEIVEREGVLGVAPARCVG